MTEMDKSESRTGQSCVFTIEDEIARADVSRPHVVIVGAGASAAAFPNGDRNGKKLPTMQNFASTLGLDVVLQSNGIPPPYQDFEGIYTGLVSDPDKKSLTQTIEQIIDDYFSSLELPDTPTLYDHLVLSLRPKDIIATFNWDPFLWQACKRNYHFSKPPGLLFLHGNTAVGFCLEHRKKGERAGRCSKCGKPYEPSRLLYPVAHKNYNANGFIAAEWETMKEAMRYAFALTFFGYGAPKTDVEAVELMRLGWGSSEKRMLEETEIIDIKKEEELLATWSSFVHSHHYQIHKSFYDSLAAEHPRRSCESLWARVAEAQFVQKSKFPSEASFDELYDWLAPRILAEQNV